MTNTAFLNHLYHVLPREGFEAVKDNDFLKSSFANIEHKILKSDNLNWEGIYIRGQDTYIELLYPQGNVQFREQGRFGIGLGTDEIGNINDIYKTLHSNIPDISKNKFTRKIDGQEIDWFNYVTQKDSFISQNMSFWIMEYEESYCKSKDISRRNYNAPFYDANKLFKNITQATIAIEMEAQQNFTNILRNIGFKYEESEKDKQIWKNQNFTLVITPDTNKIKGIRQIVIELNYPTKSKNLEIGKTNLILQNKQAIWNF